MTITIQLSVLLALVSVGCSERGIDSVAGLHLQTDPTTQSTETIDTIVALQRDASPCSQPQFLSQTQLFQEICARSQRVTAESSVQGQCWFHVQQDKQADVEQLSSSLPCVTRVKERLEIHQEAYNMMSNQLPLDFHAAPWAIGYPSNVEHVQALIKFAKQLRWKVFVVGGGHGAEAWGFGEGLVMSMINMHSLQVINGRELEDSARWDGPVLHLQAGTIWAEAYYAAERAGGLLLGGSCATVGIAGYLMGGGFGYLSGSLGFGSDQVLRMQVVTANGSAKTIDPGNDPDLFNAIRGGGQSGLAVVSDVWMRLHKRKDFGCMMKVDLRYEEYHELAWVFELTKLHPKQLHVKVRFQSAGILNGAADVRWDERKLKALDEVIVTITYVAEPGLDTKTAVANRTAEFFMSVAAPLPLGCNLDWLTCVRWAKFDCSTDHAVAFGDDGEEQYPTAGSGKQVSVWGGWHDIAAAERGLGQRSLYTPSYKHRTSVKSLLLKSVTMDTLKAAQESVMIPRSFPVYTSFVWWGNGQWSSGTGAVADVHSDFAWLVICSSDYVLAQEDLGSLQWTTEIVEQLRATVDEEFLPYPNLYDRMHVTVNDGITQRLEEDPAVSLGEAKDVVEAAKRKWDPEGLFDGRFGLGDHTLREQAVHKSIEEWLHATFSKDKS